MNYNEIAETAKTEFDNEERELDQLERDIESGRENLKEQSKLLTRRRRALDRKRERLEETIRFMQKADSKALGSQDGEDADADLEEVDYQVAS